MSDIDAIVLIARSTSVKIVTETSTILAVDLSIISSRSCEDRENEEEEEKRKERERKREREREKRERGKRERGKREREKKIIGRRW